MQTARRIGRTALSMAIAVGSAFAFGPTTHAADKPAMNRTAVPSSLVDAAPQAVRIVRGSLRALGSDRSSPVYRLTVREYLKGSGATALAIVDAPQTRSLASLDGRDALFFLTFDGSGRPDHYVPLILSRIERGAHIVEPIAYRIDDEGRVLGPEIIDLAVLRQRIAEQSQPSFPAEPLRQMRRNRQAIENRSDRGL